MLELISLRDVLEKHQQKFLRQMVILFYHGGTMVLWWREIGGIQDMKVWGPYLQFTFHHFVHKYILGIFCPFHYELHAILLILPNKFWIVIVIEKPGNFTSIKIGNTEITLIKILILFYLCNSLLEYKCKTKV